jgi:hypothetical protein
MFFAMQMTSQDIPLLTLHQKLAMDSLACAAVGTRCMIALSSIMLVIDIFMSNPQIIQRFRDLCGVLRAVHTGRKLTSILLLITTLQGHLGLIESEDRAGEQSWRDAG